MPPEPTIDTGNTAWMLTSLEACNASGDRDEQAL